MNKNKYLTGFKSALVHLQVIQSDSSNCNIREAFMAPEIWLLGIKLLCTKNKLAKVVIYTFKKSVSKIFVFTE